MRTNIDIDDALIKKAMKYSKLKTKKEIMHQALEAFVKYQMRLNMMKTQGQNIWAGNLAEMRRDG